MNRICVGCSGVSRVWQVGQVGQVPWAPLVRATLNRFVLDICYLMEMFELFG